MMGRLRRTLLRLLTVFRRPRRWAGSRPLSESFPRPCPPSLPSLPSRLHFLDVLHCVHVFHVRRRVAAWVRSRGASNAPEHLVRVLHALIEGLVMQRILTPELCPEKVFY